MKFGKPGRRLHALAHKLQAELKKRGPSMSWAGFVAAPGLGGPSVQPKGRGGMMVPPAAARRFPFF